MSSAMSPMSLKSLKPVWPSGRVGILKGAWCAWPVCGTVVVVDQAGGLPLVGRLACSRVASAVPSTPVVVGGLVVFRWRPAPERPDQKQRNKSEKVWICQTVDARATGRGFGFLCDGDGSREALTAPLAPAVCVRVDPHRAVGVVEWQRRQRGRHLRPGA